MRETTKQSISILVITLVFASAIFVLNKLTLPAFSMYQKNKILIQEKKETLSEIDSFKKLAESLNEKYNTLGSDFSKIAEAIPNNPKFADLLAMVDTIARATEVKIEDITFRDVPNKKTNSDLYSLAEVSLNISGDYISISNFFAELEKDSRLTDVVSLNMKKDTRSVATKGKQKVEEIIKAGVIIQAYYQNN